MLAGSNEKITSCGYQEIPVRSGDRRRKIFAYTPHVASHDSALGEKTAHFLSIKVGPGIFAGAMNKFNRTGEEHNTASVVLI